MDNSSLIVITITRKKKEWRREDKVMISLVINLHEMNENILSKAELSNHEHLFYFICESLPCWDDVCFFVFDIEEEELLLYESE